MYVCSPLEVNKGYIYIYLGKNSGTLTILSIQGMLYFSYITFLVNECNHLEDKMIT